MKNLKPLVLSLCFASAGIAMAQNPALYRPAVYPQQQETAVNVHLDFDESTHTYTIGNELFDAKFIYANDQLTFGGCEQMNLKAGSELFTIRFGQGGSTTVNASQMTLKSVKVNDLIGSDKAVKGSHHFNGKELVAVYEYLYGEQLVTVTWRAELREGSHYLKTDLTLDCDTELRMYSLIPMQYVYNCAEAGADAPSRSGTNKISYGTLLINDKVFCGLETPMGQNTSTPYDSEDNPTMTVGSWAVSDFTWRPTSVPSADALEGFTIGDLAGKQGLVSFDAEGAQSVTFKWNGGNLRLDVAGVELLDPETKEVLSSDFRLDRTGSDRKELVYNIEVPEAGKTYLLRYYVDLKSDNYQLLGGRSTGDITWSCGVQSVVVESESNDYLLKGLWSRNTVKPANEKWNVSAVIGLVDQNDNDLTRKQRRSFLAYSERERAVPWRAFPHYNSWYELNINRNNGVPPENNMHVEETVQVVNHWKEKLFDPYGIGINSYVWDDGWDDYKEWGFHGGFPNGFKEPAAVARQMCSGMGAWLGPRGGYGGSGTQRTNYWNDKGGIQLSNPRYFDAFVKSCSNMVENYDFRYFKFDGISKAGIAYGPHDGEETAEGIIRVERHIRENIKEDIFYNTTVGTWASPFWFQISDAIWRQDADYNEIGKADNNVRENWITYRDDMVHTIYHTESPLCPINTLMTHGVILTSQSRGSMKPGGAPDGKGHDYTYGHLLNEFRCAFACGSGLIELYLDSEKMDNIEGGALWGDLAECLYWQRENADVLPDVHWVGGDPWDKTTNTYNVYGWASYNGPKATLALRNGDTVAKQYTINLRRDLEIPSYVSGSITLSPAFKVQAALQGLPAGALNIDTDYTVTLAPNTVYVFNGRDESMPLVEVTAINFNDAEGITIPLGTAKAPAYTIAPLAASDKTLTWKSDNTDVATVKDGAITAVGMGTANITATAKNGVKSVIKVTVTENKQLDLDALIEKVQADYDKNNVDTWGAGIIASNDVFTSNASDTQEGKSFPLTDGVGTTYWHSDYHTASTTLPHWLQVALPSAVDGKIQVEMIRRINDGKLCANDNPLEFDVQVSNNGNDWTSAGHIVFPLGSAEEPTVTSSFSVDQPYSYFRFTCTKSNGLNRGYFHVGDFQLKPLEEASLNSTHPDAANTLLAAIEASRKADPVTDDDIAALQQAYDAYLAALGQEPTPPVETVSTYTITSKRGTFFAGDDYVLNTVQTSVASSVTDANKQWIYVPATVVGGEENSYFFYNVGTDKFMSVADGSNAKLSVNTDPTTAYYMWSNGNADYGFTIGDTYNSVARNTKVLNSTSWSDSGTGVRFWQCDYDEGNRLAIEEIGSITQAEYDAIVKRIKDYYTPVYTDTGYYMSIFAAFKDGTTQVVYVDPEGLKVAPADEVPEGAITKFIVEQEELNDIDEYVQEFVLRADIPDNKKYIHWTSGDNTNKSDDLDGINERYNEAINKLRFTMVEVDGKFLYRIKGYGTGSNANSLFDFTYNRTRKVWVAGNAGDVFYDDDRTSYFSLNSGYIGDVANSDSSNPAITVFDVARLIDYLNGARPEGVKLDPDADCNGLNNLDDVDAVVLRLLKK